MAKQKPRGAQGLTVRALWDKQVMAQQRKPQGAQGLAVSAFEDKQEKAKRRAETIELERARNYIRQNVSFLPLDAYLQTNPAFHRDIADGVYATITLIGAALGPVSALEQLAIDALRNNCSFVSVNNTVVLPVRSKGAYAGYDWHKTTFLPPSVTYFATGFYRKKPKSK